MNFRRTGSLAHARCPTFAAVTHDGDSEPGDDGMSMVEIEQLIDALQAGLSADEFVERGLIVRGTFDEP